MNQDNDRQKALDIDPQVSDHYASLADEKPSPDLDQAVLREAARAARADNRKGSFGAWFRPVAFMAMVGLSLAIILDLSDTNLFDPQVDMSIEPAPSGPVQPPGKNAAVRDQSPATLQEFKRQEKSAVRKPTTDGPNGSADDAGDFARPELGKLKQVQPDPAPADSERQEQVAGEYAEVGDVFTAEAENAAQRVQRLEAAADANLPPQSPVATRSSAAALTLVTPLECSDEQKTDAEAWVKCIATLRQSGQIEAAAAELENLRRSFPDFAPPE